MKKKTKTKQNKKTKKLENKKEHKWKNLVLRNLLFQTFMNQRHY